MSLLIQNEWPTKNIAVLYILNENQNMNEKSEKNLFRVNCTTFKTSLVLTCYFSSEHPERKPTRIRQPLRSPLANDANKNSQMAD